MKTIALFALLLTALNTTASRPVKDKTVKKLQNAVPYPGDLQSQNDKEEVWVTVEIDRNGDITIKHINASNEAYAKHVRHALAEKHMALRRETMVVSLKYTFVPLK